MPLFVLNHRGSGVAVVGTTLLPIGCPSTKGLSSSPRRRQNSLYCVATVGLSTMVIELTLLIPHLVEQQGINLAFIVPRGTVSLRTFSLPRGIVTVSIRSLGARGVSHRLVSVVLGASRLRSLTLARRAFAKS